MFWTVCVQGFVIAVPNISAPTVLLLAHCETVCIRDDNKG